VWLFVWLTLPLLQVDCSGYSVFPGPNATIAQQLYNFSDFDASVLLQGDVEYDVNWEHYKQTVGNTGKLECFCKALAFDPMYILEYGSVGMYNYEVRRASKRTANMRSGLSSRTASPSLCSHTYSGHCSHMCSSRTTPRTARRRRGAPIGSSRTLTFLRSSTPLLAASS